MVRKLGGRDITSLQGGSCGNLNESNWSKEWLRRGRCTGQLSRAFSPVHGIVVNDGTIDEEKKIFLLLNLAQSSRFLRNILLTVYKIPIVLSMPAYE